MNAVQLEALLSVLRWKLTEVDQESAFRALANYGGYYLLLVDGKLPMAPDDRDRRLAAIFTTEAARDAFRADLPPRVVQYIHVTARGEDLFGQLRDAELDGIVFNCCGPGDPIAFQPAFIRMVAERLGLPELSGNEESHASAPEKQPSMSPPDAPADVDGFDALALAALEGDISGPTPALDALWSAIFALPEWQFLLKPTAGGDLTPVIESIDGRRSLLAFTHVYRAVRCAEDNGLAGAIAEGMPTEKALVWVQGVGEAGRADYLQFNFGDEGWRSPIANLTAIRERVGSRA